MSDEVVIGGGNLAGYELYDLVSLNDNESAVVVTVGAQKLRVMNHLGVTKDVSPQEIRFKQNSQSLRASGMDATKTRFACGDILNVISGRHQSRSGTVKHISKGFVWLHNKNQSSLNSGVFVVRGFECSVAGSSGGGSGGGSAAFGAALSAAKSRVQQQHQTHSNASTPLSTSSRTPLGGAGDAGGVIRIGSSVRITKGEYMSMLGVVTNVDGNFLQIELSARMKKVYVTRDKVKLADTLVDSAAAAAPHNHSLYQQQQPQYGQQPHGHNQQQEQGQGFNVGMETPFLSSQTPIWLGVGSETPAVFAGDETPMHAGGLSSFASSRSMADDPWRISSLEMSAPTSAGPGGAMDRIETPSLAGTPFSDDRRVPPTSLTVTPMMMSSSSSSAVGAANTPLPTPTASSITVGAADYVPGMVVLIKDGAQSGKLAVVTKVQLHVS
jgi:transcription elongation factor